MYKRVIIGINGILLLVSFDPIYAMQNGAVVVVIAW
jgi:hypothetical protein